MIDSHVEVETIEQPKAVDPTIITVRFQGAPWYDGMHNWEEKITIIGNGGIGSWVSFFLARIGMPLNIFDPDEIELSNIGGQFFPKTAIGKNKAQASQTLLKDFADNNKITIQGWYQEDSETTSIVVCGPDNMHTRKLAYENWKRIKKGIFIDARMTIDSYSIYVVTPEKDDYESTLFPDEEATELPCNEKSSSNIAARCGADITTILQNYFTNIATDRTIFKVPQYVQHHSNFLFTKIT